MGHPVLAQTNLRLPHAGALQLQIEPGRSTPWVPRSGLKGADSVSRIPDAQDNTTVFVRRFLFQGNTLLSSEVLTHLLQDRSLQNLSTAQLYAVADKVRQAYADAGFVRFLKSSE